MANNRKNDDGIDYNDIKKFAKITGVNVVGKKKAVAIVMVLDGIVGHYKPAKENLSQEDFEEYKKVNAEMLDWFNEHKEYEEPEEQEDPEDPESEEEVGEEEPGQEDEVEQEESVDEGPEQEEAEPETAEEEVAEEGFKEDLEKVEARKDKKAKGKVKKDLAKTKDGIKKAKAEAEKKKAEAAKKKVEAKVNGESSAAYIPRFRKMLENPDTLPSKIREHIKKKGEIFYSDLKKACVDKLGCKSETSGPIGASIRVLEMDGLIRIEGKGSDKRIIAV